MTYNPRRKILGAISLKGKVAYHLFSVDTETSKTKDIIKLCRKSKWHAEYRTSDQGNLKSLHILMIIIMNLFKILGDIITGFDFNPSGERAATLDRSGVCLIADIDNNIKSFHLNMGREGN